MTQSFFDNHSHSYFSADSNMDIDGAVAAAKECGLAGLCLTDHLDFDPPSGVADFTFDVPSQQKAINEVRERISDFQLLKGVEIGLQDKSMPVIRKVLADNDFDCVIASLHLIDGHDPYFGDYYKPYDYRYAYGHYLEEFDRLIRVMPDFDILGHYDYIVRYPDYREVTIFYSEFSDVLDSIMGFLVQNGKTLEINTKTYQLYRGRTPVLDINVLKRFRELGGEAVSFGSDAHGTARIGDRFDWCRERALEAGLRYEVYFKDRKPVYIPL
ncbi:MAG TPA: histidinol-phosphatase HisJ family protein [Candidatus Coprenecus stercoravium]|uniref:Histidinol-phosphatase n=1 Tax=Candidatus Coprenecus stercoravium TaxID=2840735 RepID=A0A9D2GN91_9BACT|nr:histidinol-phosphatase HisJ family protein [Candidatus Coprenecus stercoravium]